MPTRKVTATFSKVIQSRDSRHFLIAPGEWTPDMDRAAQFESFIVAESYCRQHQLEAVDYLLSFGDPRYDLRFRLV